MTNMASDDIVEFVPNTTVGVANTKSIDFDGIDDYINAGNPTALQFTSDFSISAWFKTYSTTNQRIISKEDGSNRSYFVEVESNGNIKASVFTSNIKQQINIASALADGNWHHFVFTFENGVGTKLYIDNGTPTTLAFTNSIDNDSADFEIGRREDGTKFFDGNIDEVAVWNTALSSDAVTEIYNIRGSGRAADMNNLTYESTDPVLWYRMGDGDTFPTVTDNGSGSNNGTMTNMASGDIVNDTF